MKIIYELISHKQYSDKSYHNSVEALSKRIYQHLNVAEKKCTSVEAIADSILKYSAKKCTITLFNNFINKITVNE